MAMEDTLRSLREFDINDLDFDNIGNWPGPIKIILCLLILIGVTVDLFRMANPSFSAHLATIAVGVTIIIAAPLNYDSNW